MIRGIRPQQSGYTIVELIIVLTISIGMLASALVLFQTRLPRTQFATSVREFNTQLGDGLNQVASGYYPNFDNVQCTGAGGISQVAGGAGQGGTNAKCIFVGQAFQIGARNGQGGSCSQASPNEYCNTMNSYTVYGSRTNIIAGGGLAKDIKEAGASLSPTVGKTSYTIGYGTWVYKVVAISGGAKTPVGGFAAMQSFGGSVVNGNAAGAGQVNIVPLTTTGVGQTDADFIAKSNGSGGAGGIFSAANPDGGIQICLKSGGTKQFAVITIGKTGTTAIGDPQITDTDPCV